MEALDSSDVDALEELARHRGYDLWRQATEAEIERRLNRLESMLKRDETNYTRGVVYGLRLTLQIAEIRRREIAESLKETE